jgi:hypothetical protein
MLPPLLLGIGLLICSLVSTAVSAALIIRLVARLLRRGYAGAAIWKNVTVMVVAVLIQTAAHLVQIALWAAAFMACGEFRQFATAFYHSAGNYTTLGYGDIVMSRKWGLLGPLEAMTGVLLLGFSTALLFAVMNRLIAERLRGNSPTDDASRGRAAEP